MSGRESVLLSWSGGKDSSLALAALKADSRYEVAGLLTTVTSDYDRISIHGVRRSLLEEQIRLIGLPWWEVSIPANAANPEYEAAFLGTLTEVRYEAPDISRVAFGDLFLAEIRQYRELLMAKTDFTPLFPLWDLDTKALARRFIDEGYEANIVCVDTTQLDAGFSGRRFDEALLADLPSHVDWCGERGEFHTFVSAGPCFDGRVEIAIGERVLRENRFAFCDLLPMTDSPAAVK